MAGDKYPEWLIERVAAAMLDTPAASMPGLKMFSSDDESDVMDVRDLAVRVLDALEFKKIFSSGQLVAGRYVSWNLIGPRTDYYAYRAQTEWREVPDSTDSVVD